MQKQKNKFMFWSIQRSNSISANSSFYIQLPLVSIHPYINKEYYTWEKIQELLNDL